MKMRTKRICRALIFSPRELGRDPSAGPLLFALYPAVHSKGSRWRPNDTIAKKRGRARRA